MPTRELIRTWVNLNRHNLSDHTHTHYRLVAWRFADFAPKHLADTTPEHIERFLQHLLDSGMKASSVNSYLVPIKSLFRWAAQTYDIPNPAKAVKKFRVGPPTQRILTEAEYHKVLAICDPTERAVVQLLGNTGLRAEEAQSLGPGNIRNDTLYIVGKKQKARWIPLNKTLRQIISKDPNLNFLKNFRRRNALYRVCLNLARRAAIPQFGPHALRHFFATQLIRKNVPGGIYTVSRILGHSSVTITEQLYIHITADDLKGTTDCLD